MRNTTIELLHLRNELEKLHVRYVMWCERRQMGHAYEVECRTTLHLVDEMHNSARSIRDIGGTTAETSLPRCALNVIQRQLDELRGTLDRIEKRERNDKVESTVKW